MGLSWDEMHENAEDRQSSGGKLTRYKDGPFYISCMEVRNEFGTPIGELIIEELIPLQPTEIKDRVLRLGLWEKDLNKPEPPKVHLKFEQGPFPDEG